MNHHELKSWPQYFKLHCTGELEFTIRKDDRGYSVGDTVQFFEYKLNVGYTGRCSLFYRIRYILKVQEGLHPRYVVLLLEGPYGRNIRKTA